MAKKAMTMTERIAALNEELDRIVRQEMTTDADNAIVDVCRAIVAVLAQQAETREP